MVHQSINFMAGALKIGAFTTLIATQAHADAAVLQSGSGGWSYDLTGYLFGPISTSGTSTVAGEAADVDMNLRDALEVLDFTISGRFEAWNGDFGLAIEGNYLGISDDQTKTLSGPLGANLKAEVDVEQYWISFLGAYRFAHGINTSGNAYAFDVQAGARYNSLKQDIKVTTPNRTIDLGGTETWWEPVVAVRGVSKINDRWSFGGIVDASGFGVNDNQAWSASLGFDWQAWESTSVKFGWRYYSIDYETNRSDGAFGYDVTQHGPFVGLAWTF